MTPHICDVERLQGFDADWTKPAEDVGRASFRWKLVGNAVSVPVAAWVGQRLASPGDFQVRNERSVRPGRSWPNNAWNVGEGRLTSDLSEWPVHTPRQPLAEFLEFEPKLLSERATAGFRKRTKRGNLNFPEGFLGAIDCHLARMRTKSK